mgnify:CR=1
MMQRISFESVTRAANAKAPIVAIPIEGCKVILPRARLVAIVTCPKLDKAYIRNGKELKALVLKGRDTEYTLFSIDAREKRNTGSEMLRKWAAAQRKRRTQPKRGKLERKYAALDKQVRILEKRLSNRWQWNGEAPKNPLCEHGRTWPIGDGDFVRQGYAWNRESLDKRRKVGYLAMRGGWKRWTDLIAAVEAIGVAFPEKPRLNGQAVCLREIASAKALVSVCGLHPSWRQEDKYDCQEECKYHCQERADWLATRRERKALEMKLADLRELRTMPEKLAESDIGLPEGVTVEAIVS